MLCLADFEARAEETLSKVVWEYFQSGSNDGATVRWNREAFQRYRLRPRVLRDVSSVDMSTRLLGEEVASPIGASPTALHCLAHPDGELATAQACSKMETLMIASLWATQTMEDIAEAGGSGTRWLQIYVHKDRRLPQGFIRRAEQAGYKAIVVTADSPAIPMKLQDRRNSFTLPSHLTVPNFRGSMLASLVSSNVQSNQYVFGKIDKMIDPSLCWDDIRWLSSITHLPIIVKGVLNAEDAERAIQSGAAGILVSNHGGRQLSSAMATIDVLGEVVRAVQGRVEVYMDGGVRQGTDVLKALAMGAKAVFIGRPVLWGLAYKGAEGVCEVLQVLREELRLAMMLTGCPTLSDIGPGTVVHESYYSPTRARL